MYVSYKQALNFVSKEYHPDIICVNELGLPADQLGPVRKAINAVRGLANNTGHPSVIVAGTCHNVRTMCNTGYIFYPGCPYHGNQYHKQVSALEEEEYITIPPPRQPLVIRAFGLNIIVLICADLLDFTTVASIVQKHNAVDLILIPAHTESLRSMKIIAKAVSEAMPGAIAIVNCFTEEERPNLMYQFGSFKRASRVDPIHSCGGQVAIYEIPIIKFRDDKKNFQDRCSPHLEWLFNPTPVIKLQDTSKMPFNL